MPHTTVSLRQRRRAKHLRQAMTRAETLLWRYLKAHHIEGLGFRRQVPMQNYIVDFVCYSAKLIVELDGESHDFESSIARDAKRDAWFNSQGFTVARFTNEEVLSNLSGVVEVISNIASSRMVRPPSLSLPHKGGGNPRKSALPVATAQPAKRLGDSIP
jgi:very-short-patch-repair endonuclease